MQVYYVGMDVHSRSSTFVIQRSDGEVVGQGEAATSREALDEFVRRYELAPGTKVALESGTMAFFVARILAALGMAVMVVDAHEVRLKAQRPTQKSDGRDAFEICDGARRGIYRCIVHVPPEPILRLRETLSRRRHFVRLEAAQIHAAKLLLRGAGLRGLYRSLRSESAWQKLLQALREHPELQAHVAQHQAVWRCARDQVLVLEQALSAQQEPFVDQVRLLQSAPYVGPIIALTTIAVLSEIRRFPSSKHAASYAGLVPSTYQSGDRDAHGHITKRGSAELRAMLCEAAHHARRPDHPLNPYFASLCARRGYKTAVVAVAHRLCRILFAMLRDAAPFEVGKLGVEVGPFERKHVRQYRLKPRAAHQSREVRP